MAENKQITPLNFEIDEIGLSVLGWEISNFQARLMMKDYGRGGAFYQVAASAEVRFHADDWQVRYDSTNLSESDYLSPIVWQLPSHSRGALMSYQQMILPLKTQSATEASVSKRSRRSVPRASAANSLVQSRVCDPPRDQIPEPRPGVGEAAAFSGECGVVCRWVIVVPADESPTQLL